MSKDEKAVQTEDEKEEKKEDKQSSLEKLMHLDSETIQDLLNLVVSVGASGLYTKRTERGFGFSLDREILNKHKESYDSIKEKTVNEIGKILSALFFSIHTVDEHEHTIESLLDDIEIEMKEEKFDELLDTIKAHDAYSEIKFIIEELGQKFRSIKGRKVTSEYKDTKITYFELYLSYIDLNGNTERTRLVLNQSQIKNLIENLEELAKE